MGRKLFLSDLDGTLLTEQKTISKRTMDALRAYAEAGNVFAICTGRDINSARKVYYDLKLNLKVSFIVAFNGGQILDVEKEKTICRIGIEKSVARQVLDMSKAYGVHAHTYNDRFILTESYDECVEFYRRVIKTPVIVADDITPYMDVPPCKIIAIELHDHEKQERLKKDVEKLYEGTLSMFYSNPYYLEFVPASSGKGSALTRLSEILGIDKNDTYAAGDAENDLSMIQAAGCGIAMVNGEETVKAAADIVTEKDNDHDGLADILMNIISK